MNNDIMEFLNLKDLPVTIQSITVNGSTKTILLEQNKETILCPICNAKMHSKGIETRTIKHQVIQDGFKLIIKLKQRRLKCSNSNCNHQMNQPCNLAAKHKQHTLFTEVGIMNDFRDITLTCSSIAKKYNISDTIAYYTFMQYVPLNRSTLPRILCVDEVFTDITGKHKYSLILMNWETKEVIDVLDSRWNSDTEKYFYNIPFEERKKVEFVISDMYDSYISFVPKYFPNARNITDSFHVISMINRRLLSYCNDVKRRFDKDSINYYIISNYNWFLLMNDKKYQLPTRYKYNRKLGRQVSLPQLYDIFMAIDSEFIELKKLKDLYLDFNHPQKRTGDYKSLNEIENELSNIIHTYAFSKYTLFQEVADTLIRYREYIINSFLILSDSHKRMSNGPLESFNRKPKDYIRATRGIKNFDYFRARILWSSNLNRNMLATPRDIKLIRGKYSTGLKRGSYSK